MPGSATSLSASRAPSAHAHKALLSWTTSPRRLCERGAWPCPPVGVALHGARSGRGICDFLLFNAQAARPRLGLVYTRERDPRSRPGRMRESPCPLACPRVRSCQAPNSGPGSRPHCGPGRRGRICTGGSGRARLAREDLDQQIGGQYVRRLLEPDGQQLLVVAERLRTQDPGGRVDRQVGLRLCTSGFGGSPRGWGPCWLCVLGLAWPLHISGHLFLSL